MDQHPIPRQITTFEFKLIGSLTLHQFIFLAIFSLLAVVSFFIIKIPIVNIVVSLSVFILGLVIVFVPFNERPLDAWLLILFKRLLSPSQYYYIKKNRPPEFLDDVFIYSTPTVVANHIDARQKLDSYLTKKAQGPGNEEKKREINSLIHEGPAKQEIKSAPVQATTPPSVQAQKTDKPFLYGTIKNNHDNPLPNILVYIKDREDKPVRILKTNSSGVFATFHPLPSDKYSLDIKDLSQKYFFDKMEMSVDKTIPSPINIVSRELI